MNNSSVVCGKARRSEPALEGGEVGWTPGSKKQEALNAQNTWLIISLEDTIRCDAEKKILPGAHWLQNPPLTCSRSIHHQREIKFI